MKTSWCSFWYGQLKRECTSCNICCKFMVPKSLIMKLHHCIFFIKFCTYNFSGGYCVLNERIVKLWYCYNIKRYFWYRHDLWSFWHFTVLVRDGFIILGSIMLMSSAYCTAVELTQNVVMSLSTWYISEFHRKSDFVARNLSLELFISFHEKLQGLS